MTDASGSIITVDGPIEPDELGVTLPHEHIFADWTEDKFIEPDSAWERKIAREDITLETQWYVRNNPVNHVDNLRLDSYTDACDEVSRFRRAGGDTIVDVTPKNVGGDPELVRAVSRETGVQIVHGTAFYTRSSHPDRIDEMTRDDIAEEFTQDISEGIDGTDVRAGIIGEIGVTDTADNDGEIDKEFHDEELTVLRGGVDAAIRTGASLSIHPPFHRTAEWPTSRRCLEILDIIEEEGLPADRVIFCHRDGSKWHDSDLTYRKKLAERGAYVEFDLFGHPDRPRPEFNDAGAADTDRIQWIRDLITAGYEDRLLLSHDVFLKYSLIKYGGYGYSHILKNILPALRDFGVTEKQIETMVEDNPKRILTLDDQEL
jgi:phosphotriesterase-related protein